MSSKQLEYYLLVLEVKNAIKYSYINGKIDQEKLEYYRKNLSEDSRYTFKIVLERTEEIVIKYRNIIFSYEVAMEIIKRL